MRSGTFCTVCATFNSTRANCCSGCGTNLRHPTSALVPRPASLGRWGRRGRHVGLLRMLIVVPLVVGLGIPVTAAAVHQAERSRLADRYERAQAAEAAGQYPAAADLYADASGYRDADARRLAALAAYDTALGTVTSYLDTGRFDEAISFLDTLSAQLPGDAEVAALIVQAHASRHAALLDQGEMAVRAGDWLAAERTYATLVAENPGDPELAARLTTIQAEHAPILFGRESGIYLVGPDLDDERLITNAVPATQPVWSPDRRRIAFTSPGPDETLIGALYVVNVDGTGLTHLADDVAAFRGVAWSPDGTQIAYSSFARFNALSNEGPIALHVVDIATRVERDLTGNTWDYALSPSWSPNGDRLAFVGREMTPEYGDLRIGSGGVQILDIASGRITDVTGDRVPNAWIVSWSTGPGPDRLVIQTKAESIDGYNPGPTDLVAIDLADQEVIPVQVGRSLVSPAVWSPDGSRFAFIVDSKELRIGQWTTDGIRLGWVKLQSTVSGTFSWSPDGSSLLLDAPDGWTPSLMVRFTPDGVIQHALSIDFRMDFSASSPPQWTARNESVLNFIPTGGTALDAPEAAIPSVPIARNRR